LKFRRCVYGLWIRYAKGVDAIPPGLFNCLLTCLAGAIANLAYEGWGSASLASLTRRIVVGYLGAVCVVVLVLPWLHNRRERQTIDTPQTVGSDLRHSGTSSRN